MNGSGHVATWGAASLRRTAHVLASCYAANLAPPALNFVRAYDCSVGPRSAGRCARARSSSGSLACFVAGEWVYRGRGRASLDGATGPFDEFRNIVGRSGRSVSRAAATPIARARPRRTERSPPIANEESDLGGADFAQRRPGVGTCAPFHASWMRSSMEYVQELVEQSTRGASSRRPLRPRRPPSRRGPCRDRRLRPRWRRRGSLHTRCSFPSIGRCVCRP